jgi:lipoprotein-anchoring transpeptidase ErfK/SrfK
MQQARACGLLLSVFFLLVVCVNILPAVEQSRGGEVHKPMVDRIVVGIKDYRLVAFSNDRIVFDFPVTVGADTGPTPTGRFTVTSRLKNPWYTPDDEENVRPGAEENPIGSRWIGINKPSYGLHGTNNPETIGEAKSAGCVRLQNHQIEELYRHVRQGTPVVIRERLPFSTSKFRTVQHQPEESTEDSEEG